MSFAISPGLQKQLLDVANDLRRTPFDRVEISVSHCDGLTLLNALDALVVASSPIGARRELRWLCASGEHLSLRTFDAQGHVLTKHTVALDNTHG